MNNYTLTVETEPNPADIALLQDHTPRLPGDTTRRELGIFVRDSSGGILAGVYGWIGSGWAYVDKLWVDESLREQHYGTRLMDAFEQAALSQGVARCFLDTTSFQARPFYEKRGYQVFLASEDFINGHTLYFLKKDPLSPRRIDPTLVIEFPPALSDVQELVSHLDAFNAPYVGKVPMGDLAVLVRAGDRLIGGLAGFRYHHTFSLEQFWFDPTLHEQGCDAQAIAAFDHAMHDGIDAQHIDIRVMGDDAKPAFQAAGYVLTGVHDDFPAGSATYYLRKTVP